MKEFFDLPIVTSSYGWNAIFGLDETVSVLFVLPVAFAVFLLLILYPLFFLLGFTERKLSADLQARVGPNRTPGKGALQLFADTIKLGAKSANTGLSLQRRRFLPSLRTAALYSSFAFLPLGTALVFLDSEVGAFLPFACFGFLFLVPLFSNEGPNEAEDQIMAHRQSFLWLSAWIPALLTTLIPVARAGSAKWTALLSSQSDGVFSWTAFSSPFGFLAFLIFLFSGLVALQLPPFHSLDRGTRRRTGPDLAEFGLNEFYSLFSWCIFTSALFLGGQSLREISDTSFIWAAYQLVSTLVKASVLYLGVRVTARALPQIRQDQMTEFCWRILTPVALVSLMGELLWTSVFSGGAQ